MATQPLNIDDFAAKIKAKYPDYASVDNSILARAMVAKYPDYASQVDLNTRSAPNAGLAGVARPNVNMQPIGNEDMTGNGMPSQADMNPTADQHPILAAALKRAGLMAKGAVMTAAKPPETNTEYASVLLGPGGPLLTRLIGGQIDAEKMAAPQVKAQFQAAQNVPPGNPLEKILAYARTGTTAASMLNPFATGSVANVNQLQDQGKSNQAAGEGITDALALAIGMRGPRGVVSDSANAAKEGITPAIDALKNARSTLAEKIVAPLVKQPLGATLENAKFGRSPAQAITDEGLVGSKQQILEQARARTGELSNAVDKTLQSHPNANAQINAGPIIDSAIDNAVSSAKKTGNKAVITRLENLRTALKTEYGPIQGTPYQINQLKRQVGQVGSDLGAFKSTDPLEASASGAMSDVYTGLKNAVNGTVPDIAPLNDRMANLMSAQTALRRNLALQENSSILDSHSLYSAGAKVIKNTIASAPVRTSAARILNAGRTLDVPEVAPSATPAATPQTPIRGYLTQGAIELPESSSTEGQGVFPAARQVVRDPQTGRMKIQFLTSPAQPGRPIPVLAGAPPEVQARFNAVRSAAESQANAVPVDDMQGGHAGNGVSSVEELGRPGTHYIVSKGGQLTYHGKTFAPESTPAGSTHITVTPDGGIQVNDGPPLTPAQRFAVKRAIPETRARSAKAGD